MSQRADGPVVRLRSGQIKMNKSRVPCGAVHSGVVSTCPRSVFEHEHRKVQKLTSLSLDSGKTHSADANSERRKKRLDFFLTKTNLLDVKLLSVRVAPCLSRAAA